MKYPTMEEVEKASHRQICEWWRFLDSPGFKLTPDELESGEGDIQVTIMNKIKERLDTFGGFTPEISKELGWTPR